MHSSIIASLPKVMAMTCTASLVTISILLRSQKLSLRVSPLFKLFASSRVAR